ncbi:unnamed protein product [Ceutorhynchus assimilis]|uniref:4-nitrophenylphosphatase n=1 Tax=Ceutorhynchus assimilis TaxID=467358 RepID=A0A9N9QK14_9CUCU|nr:unnamed protein product [Ceutorhynchus assimilis]
MASKKLLDLSQEKQKAFFESFDTVFCDVDGVLWKPGHSAIEGAQEAIETLRKIGKKLFFVTNNSAVPIDMYLARMKGFGVTREEVIRPIRALIWYLKKLKFDKEVYVVGTQALKDELKEAGFKVVYNEVSPMVETLENIAKQLQQRRPDVGAVIVDFVINVDYWGLQQCIEYITKNKALFLIGASDPRLPFMGTTLISPVQFAQIIQDITGVSPKILSKPGKEFNEVLQENIGPYDPKSILFIGDSVETDMAFATEYGYQKMLTLTGLTSKEDLNNWRHDQKFKPDYVVDSIGDLYTVASNLGFKN